MKHGRSKKVSIRKYITVVVLFSVFSLGAILLAALLRDVDLKALQKTGPRYLAGIVLLLVLGTASYVAAVFLLIRSSGFAVRVTQVYLVLTSSLSLNYISPLKFGLPLRVYLYGTIMTIPAGVGTALLAVEAFYGMLIPAIAAVVGVAFYFTGISIYIPVTVVLILLLGAAFVLLAPARIGSLVSKIPWTRIADQAAAFLDQVQLGFHSVSSWGQVALVILFTLNLATHAARLYLVLHALDNPVSPSSLFFVLTISITAGNLSMIPMGLGVRDVTLVFLLAQLGVPNSIAVSAAVIQRLFAPGWPLLLGLISTNVLGVTELLSQPHCVPDSDSS